MIKLMADNGLSFDVIGYSAVINGCCKFERTDRALEMLEKIIDKGIKPTIVIYCSAWVLQGEENEACNEHFQCLKRSWFAS